MRKSEVDEKDSARLHERQSEARLEADCAAERRAAGERQPEGSERESGRERAERRMLDPDEAARLRAEREDERRELYERRQGEHEARYGELVEKVVGGKVEWDEPRDAYVNVEDILEPERAGERLKVEDPNFWNHHGNNFEFYRAMAEKYPQLRERLARGDALDQIKSDEKLRVAAEFWYGEQPVKLEKYKDSHFIEAGYHRYMLARKFNLAEIPARVKDAHDR